MTRDGPTCPYGPNPTGGDGRASDYNRIKEFEGKKYTGMRVGGSHSWCYRQGEWNETKVSPDRWQFTYAVNKRRKWVAPEGSGAPVGTEYHWYILARQNVRKLNANEYSTSMAGTKYKLAHRRAGNKEWSASDRVQLRHLIAILEENIIELRHELGEADGRRNETFFGQRTPSQGVPSVSKMRQQPLETYSVS